MHGAWCRVQGAGCRVHGAGCRVQGAGCTMSIVREKGVEARQARVMRAEVRASEPGLPRVNRVQGVTAKTECVLKCRLKFNEQKV